MYCSVHILQLKAQYHFQLCSATNVAAMHILAHMFYTEDSFLEVESPGDWEWHSQLSLVSPSRFPKWLYQLFSYQQCGSVSPLPPKTTTLFERKKKSKDKEKHKEENKNHSKLTTQTELTILDILE